MYKRMHYKKIHWLFSLSFSFFHFGGTHFACFSLVADIFIFHMMCHRKWRRSSQMYVVHRFSLGAETKIDYLFVFKLFICINSLSKFYILSVFILHSISTYMNYLFMVTWTIKEEAPTAIRRKVRRNKDWDRDRFILWSKTLFIHFSNRPKWNCSCDLFASVYCLLLLEWIWSIRFLAFHRSTWSYIKNIVLCQLFLIYSQCSLRFYYFSIPKSPFLNGIGLFATETKLDHKDKHKHNNKSKIREKKTIRSICISYFICQKTTHGYVIFMKQMYHNKILKSKKI